jgi:hypothetical protein
MKARLAALLCAGVVLGGCGDDSPGVVSAPVSAVPSATGDTSSAEYARTLQIYTAVIRQLVTVDHTFGSGPSPFKHVWVLDHAVQRVAQPETRQDAPGEPFSDALKADLTRNLSDLPPLDFIAAFEEAGDIQADPPVKDHGVIITLGPLERHGAAIHVGHEIWCGGLCAEWFTYVLQQRSGVWTITGDTGQSAIA